MTSKILKRKFPYQINSIKFVNINMNLKKDQMETYWGGVWIKCKARCKVFMRIWYMVTTI